MKIIFLSYYIFTDNLGKKKSSTSYVKTGVAFKCLEIDSQSQIVFQYEIIRSLPEPSMIRFRNKPHGLLCFGPGWLDLILILFTNCTIQASSSLFNCKIKWFGRNDVIYSKLT